LTSLLKDIAKGTEDLASLNPEALSERVTNIVQEIKKTIDSHTTDAESEAAAKSSVYRALTASSVPGRRLLKAELRTDEFVRSVLKYSPRVLRTSHDEDRNTKVRNFQSSSQVTSSG
jgi:hypothetical protein